MGILARNNQIIFIENMFEKASKDDIKEFETILKRNNLRRKKGEKDGRIKAR